MAKHYPLLTNFIKLSCVILKQVDISPNVSVSDSNKFKRINRYTLYIFLERETKR